MRRITGQTIRNPRGFTITELITALVILAILAAFALPAFNQWRQNLSFREVARNVMSELRQAKSMAIEKNIGQQVQFDSVTQSFGFNDVGSAITNKTYLNLGSGVTITPTASITFTPAGVASTGTGTVFIVDSTGTSRFYVQVDQTGRISLHP